MPRFRIFRLAESKAESYREKSPEPPPAQLRLSHYEAGAEIDAPNPYAVWKQLQDAAESGGELRPLGVGDVLVDAATGETLICNYWGFDEAGWDEQPALVDELVQQLS